MFSDWRYYFITAYTMVTKIPEAAPFVVFIVGKIARHQQLFIAL